MIFHDLDLFVKILQDFLAGTEYHNAFKFISRSMLKQGFRGGFDQSNYLHRIVDLTTANAAEFVKPDISLFIGLKRCVFLCFLMLLVECLLATLLCCCRSFG